MGRIGERNRLENRFTYGEKVMLVPEGEKYDFGYYSQTKGKVVIYEEGERNMQDSIVVSVRDLRKVRRK